MTDVLVAVKRVADSSEELVLREDAQGVDGRYVGYTIGDHDSCAVELAVRVAKATGGMVTVATVGPADAVDVLRSALALGGHAAVHVEVDPLALGPQDVAEQLAAVTEGAASAGTPYDLLLLGNDAADTGDFQVPVRLAHRLGRPVVTGARTAEVDDGRLTAVVDGPHGEETYELPLPAVVSVLEGAVEPRYPTLKGRMAARKIQVDTRDPVGEPVGSGRVRWHLPPTTQSSTRVLGEGAESAPAVVDVLEELGVLR